MVDASAGAASEQSGAYDSQSLHHNAIKRALPGGLLEAGNEEEDAYVHADASGSEEPSPHSSLERKLDWEPSEAVDATSEKGEGEAEARGRDGEEEGNGCDCNEELELELKHLPVSTRQLQREHCGSEATPAERPLTALSLTEEMVAGEIGRSGEQMELSCGAGSAESKGDRGDQGGETRLEQGEAERKEAEVGDEEGGAIH